MRLVYENRSELRRYYLADAPYGGLMFEVGEHLPFGELLSLQVVCRQENVEETLRGVALWLRRDSGRMLAGVGFLATEVEKRERLLGNCAAAAGHSAERRHPRYPTALKVTYRSSADFVLDYTRNISAGGLFVNSGNPPPVGESIQLRLYPPGENRPIELTGRVVWRRPGQGFGINFSGGDPKTRERLDRLVRTIAIETPAQLCAPIFEEVTPM